jgi:MFS family permease
MAFGMLFMPLFPSIVVFFGSITLISSGIGTLNTVLPSFISKRTPADEQGGMLGVAQSVGSIARIPGPLVGGIVAEFAGLNAAFILSTVIVMIAFGLGFTVFQSHRFRGQQTEGLVTKPQRYDVMALKSDRYK